MKRFLVLLIAAVLLGLQPAPSASAASVSTGATFNTPRPWGNNAAKYRIISKIEDAFGGVKATNPDGSQGVIYVATYFLDRKSSVDSLIAACRRGVSVRVILDGDIDNSAARRLVTTLNADNGGKTGPCNTRLRNAGRSAAGPGTEADQTLTADQALRSAAAPTSRVRSWGADNSYVKACAGSCRGKGGNMHAKFFVMSNSRGSQWVSMISSSNLNAGGAVKGWNDMWTVTGRPTTFAAFARVHGQMTDDVPQQGLDEVRDGPYTTRFFPMRNAGRGNDPTLRDLNRIGCRSAFGRTKVFISMFYWAGARGEYLARKVMALGRAGCDVRVIYGAPSKKVRLMLRPAAVKGQIQLFDSRKNLDRSPEYDVRTHGKWVAVRGTYAGNKKASVVLTGSQNWVAGSLSRGDEVTMNIASSRAYQAYVGEWGKIRAKSVRIPQR